MCDHDRPVEVGCKKPKNLKNPNFSFLIGFLKKSSKNPDFKLSVTAENCYLSV